MHWIEDLWGLRSFYPNYTPRKGVARDLARYHVVVDDSLLYLTRFNFEPLEVGHQALHVGVPSEVSECVVGLPVAVSTMTESGWVIHFVLAVVPFCRDRWRKYLVFHHPRCRLNAAIRVPITTNPRTKYRIIDRCMRYLRKRAAAADKALDRLHSEGLYAVLDRFEESDARIPARLLHRVWRTGMWWMPNWRVRVSEIVDVARAVRIDEARELAAALLYFREVGLI